MTLGQTLKQARNEKKLSLRDVERVTDGNISNGYLSLLETDQVQQPSPHHLYDLSQVYGLSYAGLMELAGYKAPNEEPGAGKLAGLAFSAARGLSKEERKQVEEYIAFIRSRRPGRKRL